MMLSGSNISVLALFKTCPTGFFPFRLEQRTKSQAKVIKIRPFGPLSPPTSFSSPPFVPCPLFILFFSTRDILFDNLSFNCHLIILIISLLFNLSTFRFFFLSFFILNIIFYNNEIPI